MLKSQRLKLVDELFDGYDGENQEGDQSIQKNFTLLQDSKAHDLNSIDQQEIGEKAILHQSELISNIDKLNQIY